MKSKEYLSLGGLFIALHLVFVLLSNFIPGSAILLVIFLPLLSTIYTLKFTKKEVVMFVIATFFLCLFFEPISTLIYIVPSLMCGVSYGVLRKYKVKELSLVYISSIAHAISLLVSFLFISLLFKEVDFFSIFETFINKSGDSFFAMIYLILTILGVIEAFILHMICDNELLKLGYEKSKEEEKTPVWMVISLFASILIYVILAIINPVYTLYIIPFVLAFLVPVIIEFISLNKRKWIYALVGFSALMSLFLLEAINVIFYPIIVIIVAFPVLMEKIVRVLYTFLPKCSNKQKNIIE